MVSSGISAGIAPIKQVSVQQGMSTKASDMDFSALMTQSLAQGSKQGVGQSDVAGVENTQFMADAANKNANPAKKESIQMTKKPENLKEDLAESPKVKEAVKEIKEKIKEEFGVTDEDIEKALEVLGLTMADLLDMGNLTDFVVELTGMESSVELLISSEFSGKLNELAGFIQETVNELSKELGMMPEDVEAVLKQALSDNTADEMPIEADENIMTQDVIVEAQNVQETDGREDTQDIKAQDVTEEEQLTVTKETTTIKVEGSKEQSHTSNDTMDMKGQGQPDLTNGIVNNLTNAVNEAFEVRGLNEVVDSARIMEQILEAAKVTLNQETTSMELMLNPENLGKVSLNVSVREGVVTASFVAQNEVVREAIESQIVMLKENLSNQGIKVEAVEVTVESHAFEAGSNNEQNNAYSEEQKDAERKSNRSLRLDSLEDLVLEDLTEEEKIVLDMMAQDGNQVNFTA